MRILVRFEGSAAPFCAFVFGNGQGLLLLVHPIPIVHSSGKDAR